MFQDDSLLSDSMVKALNQIRSSSTIAIEVWQLTVDLLETLSPYFSTYGEPGIGPEDDAGGIYIGFTKEYIFIFVDDEGIKVGVRNEEEKLFAARSTEDPGFAEAATFIVTQLQRG